ncbi:MAG: sporulation protein [Ruminococcaceae bacterium]|nr:sporulation protein [Oscillospiraceae bacterium]
MLAVSVPVRAADCRTPVRSACGSALPYRFIAACADAAAAREGCAAIDLDSLLGTLLSRCRLQQETTTEPEAPAQTEKPARPEVPPVPDAPAQAGTPEQPEAPAGQGTSTQQERPSQSETTLQQETPAADASERAYEREVVRLVNEERAKAGVAPLTEDGELSRIARLKSRDMRDRGYFDHNSPAYGTPFQMLRSFGITYRTAGENIAMGYRTPEAVVAAWMNSPGHRANILNASYTTIGVGFVADGGYWTQEFIG